MKERRGGFHYSLLGIYKVHFVLASTTGEVRLTLVMHSSLCILQYISIQSHWSLQSHEMKDTVDLAMKV